jgi:hypothetical protein
MAKSFFLKRLKGPGPGFEPGSWDPQSRRMTNYPIPAKATSLRVFTYINIASTGRWATVIRYGFSASIFLNAIAVHGDGSGGERGWCCPGLEVYRLKKGFD